MTRRITTPDWATPLAALAFYLLNRLWLQDAAQGWLNYFLRCYANDIFAGAAILAWLNLLLSLTALDRVSRLKHSIPFLFLCGLVWEFAAPIWHASAVFDSRDLLAYQLGGLLYMLFSKSYSKNPRTDAARTSSPQRNPRVYAARTPTPLVQPSNRRAIGFSRMSARACEVAKNVK